MEIRCSGNTPSSASLRLTSDQLRSTLAATTADDAPHIDFAELAKQSVTPLSDAGRTDVSFSFTTCDTTGIDLRDPQPASTFSCVIEVYGQQGKGGYSAFFQVVAERPYFESVPAGYECTSYAPPPQATSRPPTSAGSTGPAGCSTWRFSAQ